MREQQWGGLWLHLKILEVFSNPQEINFLCSGHPGKQIFIMHTVYTSSHPAEQEAQLHPGGAELFLRVLPAHGLPSFKMSSFPSCDTR